MPVLSGQASIAANAINTTLLAGSIWEFADRNYWGRLAMTGDAGFFLRATVQAGQRTHLEESQISGQSRPPILPDDLIISKFPIPRGARIVLKARNTDAAAHTIFWNLHLEPAR